MRPGIVMAITVAAVALTGIGLSSISVVFPELRKAFPGTSPATLSWIANAFTIVSAATLIPAAALADRSGKKRMVLIGVSLFIFGSFIGAVAPSPSWIIVGRTVQALGSAAYTPATAALLMSAFPPERLAAAIGVWSITGGITAAAGPPIAGALIKLGDWRPHRARARVPPSRRKRARSQQGHSRPSGRSTRDRWRIADRLRACEDHDLGMDRRAYGRIHLARHRDHGAFRPAV
jgi:MFS family permease